MDNEVHILQTWFITRIMIFCESIMTALEFSQVQDYSGSLVLVPHLANSLGHCLPPEWLGWDHVCMTLFLDQA